MTNANPAHAAANTGHAADYDVGRPVRAASTETKPSYKTTEFFAYLAMALAIIVTAYVVDGDGNNPDPFSAEHAMRYLTFLTIGYLVSRGLAKAGSREPTNDRR